MAPVEVTCGGFYRKSTETLSDIPIPGTDKNVRWLGDDESTAIVFSAGKRVAVFPLPDIGREASYEIVVDVPPIERGQPNTPVKRRIQMKRV